MPTKNNKVRFQYGTQVQYDSLEEKDDNVFYVIVDTQKIYLGDRLYTSSSQQDISQLEDAVEALENQIPNIDNRIQLLENNVLTKNDLTICTQSEYNSMTQKTSALYLIIMGTPGSQVCKLVDNNGSLIEFYGSGGTPSNNSIIFESVVPVNGGLHSFPNVITGNTVQPVINSD